jgi:hypothetical protein
LTKIILGKKQKKRKKGEKKKKCKRKSEKKRKNEKLTKKRKKKECTMDYCYNPIHSTLGVGEQ